MSTTGRPAIVTRGLSKRYGSNRGIEDVDLTVQPGEVFGFLGPNGAGKTTTIRLLLDLIRPTSGTAEVLGRDAWRDSVEVRRRVGYLPAELALYDGLTGQQVVRYLANLRGDVDRDRVRALAERFGADLSRPVRELSTGNKRKVAIVQAFMHDPELLILDEPTSGLDPLVQAEFQRLLREVSDAGATVFLSSHTLDEVDRVADRVGIMREGRLVVVEDLAVLKRIAVRRIELEFADPVGRDLFDGVDGVREVTVEDRVARLAVEGGLDALIKAAATQRVVDLRSPDVDLEEVFLGYYRGDADRSPVGAR